MGQITIPGLREFLRQVEAEVVSNSRARTIIPGWFFLTYLEDGDDGPLLGRPHVDEDIAAATHRLGDQLDHLVHREDVANVDVPAMTPRH